MHSIRVLFALAVLFAPLTARAHEYWLAPLSYQAGAGDTLVVRAYVGTGFKGEGKPLAAGGGGTGCVGGGGGGGANRGAGAGANGVGRGRGSADRGGSGAKVP